MLEMKRLSTCCVFLKAGHSNRHCSSPGQTLDREKRELATRQSRISRRHNLPTCECGIIWMIRPMKLNSIPIEHSSVQDDFSCLVGSRQFNSMTGNLHQISTKSCTTNTSATGHGGISRTQGTNLQPRVFGGVNDHPKLPPPPKLIPASGKSTKQ
jgi:hypothetical protein